MGSWLVRMANRVTVIWLVLALITAAVGPRVEKLGDRYQVALPVLALGCQIANGAAVEILLRYAINFTTLHAVKRGLGEVPLNARPRGGYEGFPSGHTSAASFGAASLVASCLRRHPVTQAVVIAAAVFTGASRITSGAHDLVQVVAGAIWGVLCALAFGPASRSRRWLRTKIRLK